MNRTGGPRGPMMMARGPPPPHMRMHQIARPPPQEQHEWGEDFERHVAGEEFPMAPAELEAEWGAAAVSGPLHHGPPMHHHPGMAMRHHLHPAHAHHGTEESWAEEVSLFSGSYVGYASILC